MCIQDAWWPDILGRDAPLVPVDGSAAPGEVRTALAIEDLLPDKEAAPTDGKRRHVDRGLVATQEILLDIDVRDRAHVLELVAAAILNGPPDAAAVADAFRAGVARVTAAWS